VSVARQRLVDPPVGHGCELVGIVDRDEVGILGVVDGDADVLTEGVVRTRRASMRLLASG
jgi:hypothetical protein